MKTHEKRALVSKTLLRATTCLFIGVSIGINPIFASIGITEIERAETVQQQVVTVSGVVKDKSGEPIIGANVLEKGTTNGVITDFDGKYTLNVKDSKAVLVISYIGLKTQEVIVGTNKKIDVTLQDDSELMDEVVVIGYGTQRKGDVTSAVASVKAEDFTVGKIGDAAELIKGKVAGLTIAKGTGDPNAESTIRLRGVISLQGSTTPLVLIDGIEGSLGTVAPENIASIDVLKDASAAAIYGTRGANGVILITTKTGKRESRTSASYSSYLSLSSFGKTLDFMSAEDVRNGLTSFSDRGSETDWLDAISRTAFTHNHNFNITGGSKNTTYSADFTYRNEQGVIIETNNEEMKMNFDIAHWMFNDMLKVNFNMVKGIHKNTATSASNEDASSIYRQAIIRNPTAPIYNADGSYNEDFAVNYYYNPVAMAKELIGEYKSEWTRMTGNITLEPIKGWQTNLMLSTHCTFDHNEGYYTKEHYGQAISGYTGEAYHSERDTRTDNLEVTSKYDLKLGKHRLNALVGYSYQYYVSDQFNAGNRNFPTDYFLYNNLGIGSYLKDGKAWMGSKKYDNKLIGFFGRISYGYSDKYNVLVSIRREGSSKFGDNHKWGTFPSASLGWTLSNEEFMKDFTWLDNLKLRAGFGITGVIPNDSYLSLTRYNLGKDPNGNDIYFYQNGEWTPGYLIASNPNPDLKWEKSTEWNFGLDFSILQDRLSGSIDVYSKKTSDLLWEYSVPTPPNLYSKTLANVGEVRNSGFEIAINAIPVQTSKFEWRTTLTASHNSSKLLSLSNDLYETKNYQDVGGVGEPITQSTHRMEVGQSLGRFFGLKSVGVSENGLWMIERPDGQVEEFNANMLNNDSYRQYLGNGLPKITLGWNNTFRYKDFDLSFQLTSQLGFKILNEPRAFYENNSIAYNRLKSVKDAPYGGQYTLSSSQTQTLVSYYIEDGDFVKLTNLTLGYTVPLRPNRYVKGIRAYVSGDNLFCITGYKGLDPELSNPYPTYAGIDRRDKYPSIRSFTFGVNINF